MIKPFKGEFELTQGFGEHPEWYQKFGLLGHNGLDWGLPRNTQVLAAISGNVIESSLDPTGYGNYIKIENDTEGCLVAHLERSLVGVGEHIQEGMVIGYSGTTGNSTGYHLHFGYFKKPRIRTNGYAGYIDPAPFLSSIIEPMNDQTIIDLGQYGKHEIQAIRGFYAEALTWHEDLESNRQALKECHEKPVEPVFTADLSQVSIQDLLIAVIKKIFK